MADIAQHPPQPSHSAVTVETAVSDHSQDRAGGRYRYCVYGIVILSDTPLALPEYAHTGLAEVDCISAPASVFLGATQGVAFDGPDSWYRYQLLDDGSTFVRWEAIGEFLVSADGRTIRSRRLEEASSESFQVYMLGQALTFALVRQRFEPLHATVVAQNGRGVAFLGDNAFGKSSLAACFLEAGFHLLTDDLLILKEDSNQLVAYPGPPRIKLFPKVAKRFLGDAGNGIQMNADTDKLILSMDDRQCANPVALSAIYSLAAPRVACRTASVSIETLTRREAFVRLLQGTLNRRFVHPRRLAHQFGFLTRVTDLVPVKNLTYPRAIDRLEEVRASVIADLGRG